MKGFCQDRYQVIPSTATVQAATRFGASGFGQFGTMPPHKEFQYFIQVVVNLTSYLILGRAGALAPSLLHEACYESFGLQMASPYLYTRRSAS